MHAIKLLTCRSPFQTFSIRSLNFDQNVIKADHVTDLERAQHLHEHDFHLQSKQYGPPLMLASCSGTQDRPVLLPELGIEDHSTAGIFHMLLESK